jgi:hypothetical protein
MTVHFIPVRKEQKISLSRFQSVLPALVRNFRIQRSADNYMHFYHQQSYWMIINFRLVVEVCLADLTARSLFNIIH